MELDNLSVKITADATEAIRSIREFSDSISSLGKRDLPDRISSITSALNELSAVRLDSFAASVGEIAKSIRAIGDAGGLSLASKGLKEGASSASEMRREMSAVAESAVKAGDAVSKAGEGLGSYEKATRTYGISLEAAPDKQASPLSFNPYFAMLDVYEQRIRDIRAEIEGLGAVTADNGRGTDEWTAKLSQAISSLNTAERVAKSYSDTLISAEMGSSASSSGSSRGGAANSDALSSKKPKPGSILAEIIRVARYRIIREALRSIFESIKSGMANIATQSPRFNESMSSLLNSIDKFKGQVTAVVEPLVNGFEPALTSIMDLLTSVAEKASYFAAIISGQGYYERAIKGNKDYASSLNSVRKAMLGIDEANILSTSESTQYERVDISDIVAAQTGLASLSSSLQGIVEAIRSIVESKGFNSLVIGLADLIGSVIGKLSGIIGSHEFLNAVTSILGIVSRILDIVGRIVTDSGIAELIDGVLDSVSVIVDFVSVIVSFVSESGILSVALVGIKGIIKAIEVVMQSVSVIVEAISTAFRGIAESLGISADRMRSFRDFISDVSNWVDEIFDKVFGWIGRLRSDIKSDDATGRITEWFANLVDTIADSYRGGIPGYATGGFPEDDSLIYVNPYEMVGRMSNGKSVVANNQQIVSGISDGVYQAVAAAMANNAGSSKVEVYLDGRQIYESVDGYSRQRGVGDSIYEGGAVNGL